VKIFLLGATGNAGQRILTVLPTLLARADEVDRVMLHLLTTARGTNRPNRDVRIHGSFRRDNGHATDIARRQNLTRCGH
jgi:hypothetical protein